MSVLRRSVGFVVVVAVLSALSAQNVWAHAGLVVSDPAAGAALGDTPTAVRLTFSENPEASLSVIRVLDSSGVSHQIGRPVLVPGDPLSLVVRVGRLGRGVYTVSWRVVSAVDGHASAGAYAFGVGVAPSGPAATASGTSPVASRFEMFSRWVFLAGLMVLLGAAFATLARFGEDARLAPVGWLLAVVGLLLLAEAQRREAGTSIAGLLHTPVGRMLVWRGVAIGTAGAALFFASRARGWRRRWALIGAVVATLSAIAVHVAAGHAAAGPWPHTASLAVQSAHVAAAGLWLGGLAALLLSVRGAPSAAKAVAVRRFSIVALVGLIVVAGTGIVRAVEQLSTLGDLVSTGYGLAITAKIALLLCIALLGALNRWRSVPRVAADLRPLRVTARAELVLAAVALAAAAVLGSLAPPVAGRLVPPLGLSVAGADSRSTVRVQLSAASADPGPNRFVVHAVGYESNAPIYARKVSLRFTPLDDPDVASSSLELRPAAGYSYVGSGANLVFDGRWGVDVVIQRYVGRSVQIPLELDARGPPQFVSVERIPGQAPKYTVQVGNAGYVRVSPQPEPAGPSKLYVTCYDVFSDEVGVRELVLTAAGGTGPTSQHPVRRLGPGRFVSDVDLVRGRNTITVVARTTQGARLRAVVELPVPND
jgi:copper transport protein